MEVRDPKSLGVAVRIKRWLEGLERGELVPTSDLKWLIGQTRFAAYKADIAVAKVRLKEAKEAVPAKDVTDGEVPGYLKALLDAKGYTKDAQKEDGRYLNLTPGSKSRDKAFKRGIEKRAKAKSAQEALVEAWEVVDPKYHYLFESPPVGGWSDKGPIISEFEWPPRLPFKELELRRDPELIYLPHHQQTQLLEEELRKLLVVPPVCPVEPLQGRMAKLSKLAAG